MIIQKAKRIYLLALTGLTLSLAASQVYAVGIENPLGNMELQDIIQKLINFLFGLALLVCPMFIIWGGFEIITAAGADQKIKEGRQKITYSLVGLVIIALAGAFVRVIRNILGV